MFDAIMHIEFLEVERVFVVALFQHEGSVMGHERTERRRDIVRRADFCTNVSKFDPAAIAIDYP